MNLTYKSLNINATTEFKQEVTELMAAIPELKPIIWSWIVTAIELNRDFDVLILPDQALIKRLYLKQLSHFSEENKPKQTVLISPFRFEYLESWNYRETIGLVQEPEMDLKLRSAMLGSIDFRNWLYSQLANYHSRKQTHQGWFSVPIPDQFKNVGKWMGFMELEKGGVYLQVMEGKRLYS